MTQAARGKITPSQSRTSPGVKIPPPVVYALALAVGWGIQRALPLPTLPLNSARLVGLPIAIIGLVCIGLSVATMVSGHGTLSTDGASQALVAKGMYRLSRNPMYLALSILYAGVAIALDQPWALLMLPVLLIYVQKMVIAREEAFLAQAFGQDYAKYKAHVRRWL
jgi:protein-S-isoprenylcysteine O-methyltransferase Ste14